jgi:hypothetical protein
MEIFLNHNFFLNQLLINYNRVGLLVFTYVGYFFGNIIFKKIKFNNFINILNLIIFLSAIYLIFSELNKIFF